MGKKKGKKADRVESVGGENANDVLVTAVDGETAPAPSKSVSKGKRKKADDNWEDDVLDEIAQLSMKPSEKEAGDPKPVKDPKTDNAINEADKQKEKDATNGTNDDFEFYVPSDDEKDKKKKKKKQPAVKDSEDPHSKEDEESSTVKTKAQKQAEKKEREKKKKEQQKMEAKRKLEKEQAEVPSENDMKNENDPQQEDLSQDKEESSSSKKKNKKKKKGADESKDKSKTTKKPNKAMIKAMQEQLSKIKEEEEKRKREEEEELRKAEEAEKLRLQKLEEERLKKEKKKQKEKERIQRLKMEGKYLTPTQKEAQRRREAYLESLREQGLLPTEKATKEKRPRYDRRRQKKQDTEETPAEEIPVEEKPQDEPVLVEAPEENAAEEQEEDVLDDWEAITDEWDAQSLNSNDSKEVETETKQKGAKDEEEELEEDDDDDGSDEEESEEESSSDSEEDIPPRERALRRIQRRKERHEANRSTDKLRSPVICVMGHVDTGKTKILDKIRHSQVQEGEAGGITQQIGATFVPAEVVKEQTKMVKSFQDFDIGFPGLLIIDTPGHESFSNLRSRGSSLCDMAILVVDVMHGLESQTLESIAMLKKRKTPFVVALNKVDRLYEWKRGPDSDIVNTLKKQKRHVKDEFDERLKDVIVQFATQNLNVKLFYENDDPKEWISMVPTSAHSGDGMGNLISLVVELCQNMLARRLSFSDELECTVLEVKAIQGLGTTVDVILTNGELKYGDNIVLAGVEGPIVTHVKGLLMPQPLKELRVKNPYNKYDKMVAAQGVKILAKDLEKALAGTQLLVAHNEDEIDLLKEEVQAEVERTLKSYKLQERGVYVQASTLGSLEALLAFLDQSKIPYAGISIGPVHKKDIMKASVMLEHDSQWAVVLAFDVKVEREAQDLADNLGVKIFTADIIYHLFDSFMQHREDLKKQKQEEFRSIAVFPCKLRIMPNCVFKSRDPIVVGVNVEAGQLHPNTPICVPSKEFLMIGFVTSIEFNHKPLEIARAGQEVCIKIEGTPGEPPKMVGRHFDESDVLVSKISRESINALKDWFRDEMQKPDWQLTIELKKMFDII